MNNNVSKETYTVEVTRDGQFWSLYVTELDYYTQAERIDQIETRARDLIETVTEDSSSNFNLKIVH